MKTKYKVYHRRDYWGESVEEQFDTEEEAEKHRLEIEKSIYKMFFMEYLNNSIEEAFQFEPDFYASDIHIRDVIDDAIRRFEIDIRDGIVIEEFKEEGEEEE
jgi:hypothetical protein